jgi:Putative lumazine-binding
MIHSVSETEAVHAVIGAYITGAKSGDLAVLAEAFHSSAWMYGFFGGAATNVPIADFFTIVTSNPSPSTSGEEYRAVVSSVSVTGTAASAIVQEENYLGCDFVDHFSLLRTDGKWQIVAKTYHQVR